MGGKDVNRVLGLGDDLGWVGGRGVVGRRKRITNAFGAKFNKANSDA